MRETFEFRVVERFAHCLFASDEGKKLSSGIIRLIKMSGDDPRLPKIGDCQRAVRREFGRAFFYGWQIYRKYNRGELDVAERLQLKITTVFEPSGEECGTEYNESTACALCGAGAVQISDLRLDLRKVPKGKHIALTIADEYIVSQHLAERMLEHGLTGFELRPVRHKAKYEDAPMDLSKVPSGREILRMAEAADAPHPAGKFWVWLNRAENADILIKARQEHGDLLAVRDKRRGKPLPVWHQLIISSANAEIVPPTRVGLNPFDDDVKGECRCPQGDLMGLNLLSEVSISADSRGDFDIVCSRQYVGIRRGLLRPNRVMFISRNSESFSKPKKLVGRKSKLCI